MSSVRPPRSRFGTESREVLRSLQDICAQMQPGDVVPTYQEIMQSMDASERSVRWALDELSHQGIIIRRPRARTIIASSNGKLGHSVGLNGRAASSTGNSAEPLVHPILAIGEPDGGVFDHAMRVLMKRAQSLKMVVHCQFLQSEEINSFAIPSIQMGVRSFIVFRQHFLPLAERLQVEGHRVIFVGTPLAETRVAIPSVSGDQEQGGYLSVKHLLDLGHRRLAFHFASDYGHLRRWQGCRRAIDEARRNGVEVQEEMLDWVIVTEWRQQPSAVKSYFARVDAPTGIVSWNDDTTIELLTILLVSGIRVPNDVSLVGYDNLKRSAEAHPAITTIDTALDTQILIALRLLEISTNNHSHRTIVTPTLVRRDSTGAARLN